MITTDPLSITLPVSDWLLLAGWMMGQPTRPRVTTELVEIIGQAIAKTS